MNEESEGRVKKKRRGEKRKKKRGEHRRMKGSYLFKIRLEKEGREASRSRLDGVDGIGWILHFLLYSFIYTAQFN